MSIATFAAYDAKLTNPYDNLRTSKTSSSNPTAGRLFSLWAQANGAGTTPSSAAVPTSATAGALQLRAATGLVQRIGKMSIKNGGTTANVAVGSIMLVDRLSHQGGLSALALGEQTTNLPTAALTRYTDGLGVWIAIHVYTQIGTVNTTVTVRYTNQASTGSRTTVAIPIGGTGYRNVGTPLLCPLQAGDTGVLSVEGLTMALSTGTAGNIGISLVKPLIILPQNFYTSDAHSFDAVRHLGGMMPQITSSACLEVWTMTAGTITGQQQLTMTTITE